MVSGYCASNALMQAESQIPVELRRIDECTRQASAEFFGAVRPIYFNRDHAYPQLIGSCFLFEFRGRPLLCMAAHTADEARFGNLSVGGGPATKLVHIPSNALRVTPLPLGGRRQDHIDFAFWRIPDHVLPSMGAVRFLNETNITLSEYRSVNRAYAAMGYPISRNQRAVNSTKKTTTGIMSTYTGGAMPIPAFAAESRISGDHHVFLNYPKQPVNASNERRNPRGVTGMSGGPLLDLGDFGAPDAYTRVIRGYARLAGILIEDRRDHYRALVALKIGYALKYLDREYPLRPKFLFC